MSPAFTKILIKDMNSNKTYQIPIFFDLSYYFIIKKIKKAKLSLFFYLKIKKSINKKLELVV